MLNRIGGANPLHGSNVDLMERMIDPVVFQRMLEASSLAELYQKIENAIGRTQDKDTLLHLRLIRSQLANVS